jgi:hypothetical protein
VFYLDSVERASGSASGIDDSTSSTSMFISDDTGTSTSSSGNGSGNGSGSGYGSGNGSGSGYGSGSGSGGLLNSRLFDIQNFISFIKQLKSNIKGYFFGNSYDLNILVDCNKNVLVETTVMKGDLGIGLDIRKKNKMTEIAGFKKFPSWTSNPAQLCNPPILEGDCIVGINGTSVKTFSDTVRIMKDLPNGEVVLHLRRAKKSKIPGDDNAL